MEIELWQNMKALSRILENPEPDIEMVNLEFISTPNESSNDLDKSIKIHLPHEIHEKVIQAYQQEKHDLLLDVECLIEENESLKGTVEVLINHRSQLNYELTDAERTIEDLNIKITQFNMMFSSLQEEEIYPTQKVQKDNLALIRELDELKEAYDDKRTVISSLKSVIESSLPLNSQETQVENEFSGGRTESLMKSILIRDKQLTEEVESMNDELESLRNEISLKDNEIIVLNKIIKQNQSEFYEIGEEKIELKKEMENFIDEIFKLKNQIKNNETKQSQMQLLIDSKIQQQNVTDKKLVDENKYGRQLEIISNERTQEIYDLQMVIGEQKHLLEELYNQLNIAEQVKKEFDIKINEKEEIIRVLENDVIFEKNHKDKLINELEFKMVNELNSKNEIIMELERNMIQQLASNEGKILDLISSMKYKNEIIENLELTIMELTNQTRSNFDYSTIHNESNDSTFIEENDSFKELNGKLFEELKANIEEISKALKPFESEPLTACSEKDVTEQSPILRERSQSKINSYLVRLDQIRNENMNLASEYKQIKNHNQKLKLKFDEIKTNNLLLSNELESVKKEKDRMMILNAESIREQDRLSTLLSQESRRVQYLLKEKRRTQSVKTTSSKNGSSPFEM